MYGALADRCKKLKSGKECQWQSMMKLMEDSRNSRKSGDHRRSADRKSPTHAKNIRQRHKSGPRQKSADRDRHHRHKSGACPVSADRKSPTPDEDTAEGDQDDEDVVLDDIDEADMRRLTVQMELKCLKEKQARRVQRRVVEEVAALADNDVEEPPAIVHEILGVQFTSKDDKSCQAVLVPDRAKVQGSDVGTQMDDDERERIIKAEEAKMHNLFRIMLMHNDAMGYGVPPKKRNRDPVCIVTPRPGHVQREGEVPEGRVDHVDDQVYDVLRYRFTVH